MIYRAPDLDGEDLEEAKRGRPSNSASVPNYDLDDSERKRFRQLADAKPVVMEALANATDAEEISRASLLRVANRSGWEPGGVLLPGSQRRPPQRDQSVAVTRSTSSPGPRSSPADSRRSMSKPTFAPTCSMRARCVRCTPQWRASVSWLSPSSRRRSRSTIPNACPICTLGIYGWAARPCNPCFPLTGHDGASCGGPVISPSSLNQACTCTRGPEAWSYSHPPRVYTVYMTATEQHGDTTVRLPRTLVEQVRSLAQRHERSLSAELRVALRHYIEQQGASNGKA